MSRVGHPAVVIVAAVPVLFALQSNLLLRAPERGCAPIGAPEYPGDPEPFVRGVRPAVGGSRRASRLFPTPAVRNRQGGSPPTSGGSVDASPRVGSPSAHGPVHDRRVLLLSARSSSSSWRIVLGRSWSPACPAWPPTPASPSLRHLALQAGADVVELQTLLGHQSLDTTSALPRRQR